MQIVLNYNNIQKKSIWFAILIIINFCRALYSKQDFIQQVVREFLTNIYYFV